MTTTTAKELSRAYHPPLEIMVDIIDAGGNGGGGHLHVLEQVLDERNDDIELRSCGFDAGGVSRRPSSTMLTTT